MAILRNRTQDNFTMISNNIFRDTDLSLKDRGLLCTLMSLPDSWEFSIGGLAAILKDGKDSIRSSLKYIEELGYIKRYQSRNPRGQFETILEVTAERITQSPDTHSGLSVSENPTRLSQHGETVSDNSTEYNTDNLISKDNTDDSKPIIPSFRKNKNIINNSDWNERMNDIPHINTFIESTKRRINYSTLMNNLNDIELQYVDRIVIIISAYIADKRLRSSVKISGKYLSDNNSVSHLLKYKYDEVFAVVKNMINSNTQVDKPDSYYLTALDKQLMINSPEIYASIDDPLIDDDN